jgi:hypothetical protein
MGAACRLRMIHEGLAADSATSREVGGGWSHILSSLKTLLETGRPLVIGAPASEAAG